MIVLILKYGITSTSLCFKNLIAYANFIMPNSHFHKLCILNIHDARIGKKLQQ